MLFKKIGVPLALLLLIFNGSVSAEEDEVIEEDESFLFSDLAEQLDTLSDE